MDVKLNVFKKVDKKEFRLIQNFTMGEADFNQFTRLRNQLDNAAGNSAREEKSTEVLILTTSQDMGEQLKRAHKVVDLVDRAKRKTCVTLLRYNVDKAECSYAQVRLIARRKEDDGFQRVVYVNFKLWEFICLLVLMKILYAKIVTNQTFCSVLWKKIASVYFLTIFLLFESRWIGTMKIIETFSHAKKNWDFIILYL